MEDTSISIFSAVQSPICLTLIWRKSTFDHSLKQKSSSMYFKSQSTAFKKLILYNSFLDLKVYKYPIYFDLTWIDQFVKKRFHKFLMLFGCTQTNF
jgi:hypothetical protein